MARNRTTRRTTPATTDVATTTTTDVAIIPADVPAIVPANDIDARIDAAFPGNVSPTMGFVRVMSHAFARVAPMPVATVDDRIAVRATIIDALAAAFPGTTNTGVRNTGMFGGMHVFETQNAMYLAAALSGAYITDGHFVAAWSAELPNARCAFITTANDKRYPTSTLSEYFGNRHNAVPGIDGARDVVWAWHVAKRNRPTPATA